MLAGTPPASDFTASVLILCSYHEKEATIVITSMPCFLKKTVLCERDYIKGFLLKKK